MTDTSTSTPSSKDKLVNDIKLVIADAEQLSRETAGALTGKAKEIRQRLDTRIADARVQLHELEGVVREKAIEGAKETDRVIREHPYESIGIAFGLGILLGALLNRK